MANLKDINYGIGKYLEASDASSIPDIATNRANIDLLNFKVAANNSYALYNMKDGFVDAYQDTSGVDASASTNGTRDSSGKYYSGTVAGTATGGTITTSGDYKIHTFTSSGTFNISAGSGTFDYLVIAGGGGGAGKGGGGGGAGGYRTSVGTSGGGGSAESALSLSAGNHTVTVGAGGSAGTGGAGPGNASVGGDGGDSVFSSITSTGGGGGGYGGVAGRAGGSGGGAGNGSTGGSATANQGYDGGDGAPGQAAGGGGGASQQGEDKGGFGRTGGYGGAGVASTITGSSVTRAGGGGGGAGKTGTGGTAGSGGGGAGGVDVTSGSAATANTGGGGGGGGLRHADDGGGPGSNGAPGGAGGSGVVIVRYEDGSIVDYNNMTLVSNVQTAQAQPSEARITVFDEPSTGATTINTDIKAYASRDNGTTYSQITLANDGNYTGGGLDSYTKLLLHCDGSDGGTTFTDSSATGHTMTASGDAHTDTTIKKFGTASAQFDGTGDYITSAASSEFSLTGDFTIDCWCYFSAINTTIAGSLSNWDWNSASTNDWILLVDGGGNITFNVKNVGGLSSSGHGALNAWKHIAVERTSGTTKIYVDGVLGNSGTGPGSGTVSANNIVTLGRAATNLTGGYNGYIDEFRITNGTTRYGGNFIPSTEAYSTSKRLLSGSADISGQPAGTNMRYKIETLNQSSSKITRLHGVSLQWA